MPGNGTGAFSPYSNPSTTSIATLSSSQTSMSSSNTAITTSASTAEAVGVSSASSMSSTSSQFLTPGPLPTVPSGFTPAPRPTPKSASGCPPSMKGVTFNSGMNPGMFDTIGAGEDWTTFQPTIPNGPGSSKASSAFIPMIAFASDVQEGINMLNSANPPPWLLTFNEPDFSYEHYTKTMSPGEAASAIAPLIAAAKGKPTKFVAPVTANSTSDWLDNFYAACNCKNFFSAYNIHKYHPDSATVISEITTFHQKYPDKPIWVTEVAPGSANPPCSLGWDAVGTFMKDIYGFAAKSGFVDRVFWNTGNQIGPGDTNVCNSYLTDHTGGASPLLAAYAGIDCS